MAVAGPGLEIRRVDRQRRPDLNISRRILELRAHDSDYGIWQGLQTDHLPDDVRVSGVSTLPEAVTQDDNMFSALLILILSETAAQSGLHSQQREEIGRDAGRQEPFGFPIAGEVVVGNAAQDGDVLEHRVLRLQVAMVGRRHRQPVKLRRLSPERHEPLRLRERQRAQHDGIDDAENRRRGADAEREREHSHGREAGVLEQLAECVTKVVVHSGSGVSG